MAVTKGNHTLYTTTSTGSVTQIQFSHDNDGDDVILAVNEPLNGSGQTVTAKYNGVAMTLVGRTNSSTAAYKDIWVFKKSGAAAGSNTVEVNFSHNLTKATRPCVAVSMSGLSSNITASTKFKAQGTSSSISDSLSVTGTKPVLGFCVSRFSISDTGAQTYLTGGTGGVYASITASYDGEVSSSASHAWSYSSNVSSMAILVLDPDISAPTVTTQAASAIGVAQATLNGNITDTGGENCTSRGFYLVAGTGTPTSSDTVVSESGSFGTGAYALDATSLLENTLYSARAFSTNSAGTSVGAVIQFTTDDLPEVTTNAASNVKHATATLNAEVTDEGGSTLTNRGFYYKEGTSGDPTALDTVATEAAGAIGAYSINISGLTAETSYRIASFATNAEGTKVGATVAMTTGSEPVASSGGIGSLSLSLGKL